MSCKMRGLKIFSTLMILGFILLALPVEQVSAQTGDTWTVCPEGGGCNFTSIQDAIDAASAGDTIQVADGTYVENIVINKNIALLSVSGRDSTIIEGVPGLGSLAAIVITNNTDGVQIGDMGQGFTILGIDNGFPGVENAAVYFQGNHSNAHIIDNEIVAQGDSGLMTEWGAVITGFVISHNEFSGQTFVGEAPGGEGFGGQFSDPNVPRQLVAMGGGSGGGNTSDITFTDNEITGTAGGLNEESLPQGNTLVTIDSVGSTILNNIFSGTTARYGTSLRARGPNASISGNTFVSTGLTVTNGHLYIVNNPLNSALVSANSFDKAVYVESEDGGTIGFAIQPAIDAVPEGTTIHVTSGTYEEELVINKPLTLLGPNAGKAGDALDRVGEAIVTFPDGLTGLEHTTATVESDGVTIDGFKFEDKAYLQAYMAYHIHALNANNLIIQNNLFIGTEIPIYRDYTGPVPNYGWEIKNNKMVGGPFVNSHYSRGMYIWGTAATISGNVIDGYGVGIQISPDNEPMGGVVENNVIAAGHSGLYHNVADKGSGAWSYSGNTITVAPNDRSVQDLYSNGGAILPEDELSFRAIYIRGFGNSGTGDLPSVSFTNNTADLAPEPGSYLVDQVAIFVRDAADGAAATVENNAFTNYSIAVENTTGAIVDASPNWWGSIFGPRLAEIEGDVEYVPWCGDEDCSFLVPDDEDVITLSSDINIPGGIEINQPGLTIFVEDGTVIHNDSPCFIINADYTTITTESPLGAVCMPTNGSNAIEVNGDRTNIVIEGLEIDGADGTNGIDFDGVVTDLVIRDNYIHGLAGDGLFFGDQPVGTLQIQGNLFMDNDGNGIESGAFTVPAEFNAWGSYAGPAVANGGDGISGGVSADPWTHVDLYLEPSGTDYPGSVYLGEQITFEVRANLVNAMGVDFVLDIPGEYSVVDAVPGGQFDNEALTSVTGGYHFVTYQMGSGAVSGEDLVLFTLTLEGASVGKPLTLNLDEMSDVFSMAPGYGPSTIIYAVDLADYTGAEVNAFPTMDIVPSGAYIAGLPIEFSVDIDNANGDDFASAGLDFSLPAGAILEYWDGSAWVEVSSNPFIFGGLAGDAAPSIPFRVLFVSGGSNVVSVDLYDLTPNTLLASASETFVTLGDFNVSGTISMQGRSVRSGVPLKLASMTMPYYPDNDIFSSNEISNNVLFTGVNGGLFNISTSQERYLNVSAAMGRTLDITGDLVLPDLELKGGNADWSDNVIDISDAGVVGGLYGDGGLADNADVNFDDRVNIQDLALVGGNFDLTSEEAYAGWPGFTEVSGTFNIDGGTGEFIADMTGAYDLHIVGQGIPVDEAGDPVYPPDETSYTYFSGTVSGDISGTIEGMINAQGMDILYAVITPVSGDPVRLYGTLFEEFEGWLVSGPERNPVSVVEISGPATVEKGSSINLEVALDGDAPDRPVLWSVYVDNAAVAEIDMYTGELTGLSAGTATVIVTVLDDGNVSFDTYSVTVTAP